MIFTLIIIKQNNSLKSLLIHFHSHYLMNMDRQKGTYIKVHQHWIIGITNSMVIYNSVGPMKLNKSFYMLHRKLINTVFRNMSFKKHHRWPPLCLVKIFKNSTQSNQILEKVLITIKRIAWLMSFFAFSELC